MYRSFLVLLMLLAYRTPAGADTHHLPFRFELNEGQADPNVKYLAYAAGFTAHLSQDTVTLNLRRPVHMRFAGANPDARITAQDEMAVVSHYYRGKGSDWCTDIKNYERLLYRDVYPGIDVVFYGKGRILEFDFIVHSGAHPESIALDFTGQQEAAIDGDGDLRLKTEDGEVRLHAPQIYAHGKQQTAIGGRFVKKSQGFGVEVAEYKKSDSLVIDPAITFSTYDPVRGGNETPTGIAVDQAGNLYVSYYMFNASDEREFQFVIHKIPRDGSPGYITNIWELRTNSFAHAITLDAGGNAYIAGTADNTPPGPNSIPTSNAIQPRDGGGIDAFIVKLDSTGKIVFSTYLGGSGDESATAIGLDGAGGFWVAGTTTSADFPTVNAFQNKNAGGRDGFLTRFNTAGASILYSTYLGGNGDDDIKRLVVDSGGNVFFAGETTSNTFPGVSDDLQPATPECSDSPSGGASGASGVARPCIRIFLSKLNPAGTAVLESAAVKLTGGDNSLDGFAQAADGSVFIGRTAKLGSAAPAFFVEKRSEDLKLIYTKQIYAKLNDIAVDPAGSVYLTGSVQATDVQGVELAQFPILNSFKPGATDTDLFVMKLLPDGSAPAYSTLLGATCTLQCPTPDASLEVGYVVTADNQGRAYVAGVASGLDFPTTNGSHGTPPSRINDADPVVFVLDTNVPNSTTLYTRIEESSPVITYKGNWIGNTLDSGHSGRTAKLSSAPGASFSLSFTGAGELKWYGCRDEWSGIAQVFLDGGLVGTVDTFMTPGRCGQLIRSVTGIRPGNHTFTVEVLDSSNTSAKASWVWIDKIEISSVGDIILGTSGARDNPPPASPSQTTRVEQTSPDIKYSGRWFPLEDSENFSGGSAVLALDAGAKATISFTGTRVQWIGLAERSGIAKVYIDGVFQTEVNTYTLPASTKKVLYSASGLSPGRHTLTIEVSGRADPASTQPWIWIDAFDVESSGTP